MTAHKCVCKCLLVCCLLRFAANSSSHHSNVNETPFQQWTPPIRTHASERYDRHSPRSTGRSRSERPHPHAQHTTSHPPKVKNQKITYKQSCAHVSDFRQIRRSPVIANSQTFIHDTRTRHTAGERESESERSGGRPNGRATRGTQHRHIP